MDIAFDVQCPCRAFVEPQPAAGEGEDAVAPPFGNASMDAAYAAGRAAQRTDDEAIAFTKAASCNCHGCCCADIADAIAGKDGKR